MTENGKSDEGTARQGRMVALVIAGTTILWLAAQWLGASLGWDARYVFLFDFAALAAFIWVLFVTWQIWRRRER